MHAAGDTSKAEDSPLAGDANENALRKDVRWGQRDCMKATLICPHIGRKFAREITPALQRILKIPHLHQLEKGAYSVHGQQPENTRRMENILAADMPPKVKQEQEPEERSRKKQRIEAQFQPLLEQLRYGKLIKKIAEIRQLTKAGMKSKFGEENILPRIIVIGSESSGKSSTLERIAGQPVLPCDTGICTRAPVMLELKYDPEASKARIYFKGFEGDYEEMRDAEQARGRVKEAMDSLKGVGVAADKEVRVKIVSQDVPSLDLVDLPGLVLARNNQGAGGEEPDNISELTIQCAKKYIDSSNTAVVLCIVAASEPNLRTVKVSGLLTCVFVCFCIYVCMCVYCCACVRARACARACAHMRIFESP